MTAVEQSLATVRASAPDFAPRVGLILGSGLGDYVARVRPVAVTPYAELPGFPAAGVKGHAGRLVLGHVRTTPVAVLQGRAHYYEHGRADVMKVPVRVLANLGCELLLCTNAAGSVRTDMPPGTTMMITDHINFTGTSPLFGEAGDERFVDMSRAYDSDAQNALRAAARSSGITLHEGVYMWFCGPSFETPAEVRLAARLGADAVGMSTVPEIILARHAGLKAAGLSVITNFAAGMSDGLISHGQTISETRSALTRVSALLDAFLAVYGSDQ